MGPLAGFTILDLTALIDALRICFELTAGEEA